MRHHKTASQNGAVFFLPKFHVKQIFCSFFIYINLISILYQSYITLQSPFVGYFYFVDFQIFSTTQSKILNILTFINVKYLHHTKIMCNFVS